MRAVLVSLVICAVAVAATQQVLHGPSGIKYVIEGINHDYKVRNGEEYYTAGVVEESVPRFVELLGERRSSMKNAFKARRRAKTRAAGVGDWTETGTVLGQGGFGRVTEARQSGAYTLVAPVANGALRVALKKQFYGYRAGDVNPSGGNFGGDRPFLAVVQTEVNHQRTFHGAGCGVPAVYDEWFVQAVAANVGAGTPAKGAHFMIMEKLTDVPIYANGDVLTPATRFKRWGAQLITAIRCLHTNDYVHRDLKIFNVMVTADMATLKVVDMGLVRQITGHDYAYLNGHGTGAYRDAAPYTTLPLVVDQLEDYNVGILLVELAYGGVNNVANTKVWLGSIIQDFGNGAHAHISGVTAVASWGFLCIHGSHETGVETVPSISANAGISASAYIDANRAIFSGWVNAWRTMKGFPDVGSAQRGIMQDLVTHTKTLTQAGTAIGNLP